MGTRRDVMGQRKPGGRLKPKQKEDPRLPTLWRRIKDHGVALGMHPYVGTVLGRLSLAGVLLDHQVQAGFRFAEIVGTYDRLCSGARFYTVASPAYERGFGDGAAPTDSDATIARIERAATRARKRYERVMRCIPSAAAESLLIEACIENREVSQLRHGDLRVLLGVLASSLGIQHDAAGADRRPVSREAKRLEPAEEPT